MKLKAYILLFILVALFFYKTLFLGYSSISRDIPVYFYPQRLFTHTYLKQGIIPLWNPYIFCGVPFLANPQAQLFYPFSFIIYLFGVDFGLKLFIAFHFFLAGISTYLLAKKLGLSKDSSIIAAVCYTFSGFLVSSCDIPIAIAGSSWIPLIFYLYLKSPLLCGFALFFQILAGEPFIFYITAIFLCFHSIFSHQIRKSILIITIGISLSLFQTLPFIEFSLYSLRFKQGHDPTMWSFAPWEIIRFLIPTILGNPNDQTFEIANASGVQFWLESPYIGIIPLLLVLLAFKERKYLFFLCTLIFSLLFSFGRYTPFYTFITQFFLGFELLRFPVKFLAIFTLCASILAGFGFSLLLLKKGFSIFFFFSMFFSFLTAFLYIFKGELVALMEIYVSNPYAEYWASIIFLEALFITFILISATFIIFLFKKEKIKGDFFFQVILFLIIVDLFIFTRGLNPLTAEEIYSFKPKIVEYIKAQDGIFRIFTSALTRKAFMEPYGKTSEECVLKRFIYLMPNTSLLYRIFDCYGFDPIMIARHKEFIWQIETRKPQDAVNMLSLINAKYIISKDPIKGAFKFVFQDGRYGPFLYENSNFLPRAFFVPTYKVIKDSHKALAYLASKSFNPLQEVILEEEPGFIKHAKGKMKNAKCKIVRYEPNRIIIEAETPSGFLFFSDTYYPGWRAYINKKETKIYRANYCFRAIHLEAGKHKITFEFLPKTFIIGIIASLSSLILILFSLVLKGSLKYLPSK